jgi:hypothetical protein
MACGGGNLGRCAAETAVRFLTARETNRFRPYTIENQSKSFCLFGKLLFSSSSTTRKKFKELFQANIYTRFVSTMRRISPWIQPFKSCGFGSRSKIDIQLASILNVLWQLLGRTASLGKNLWLVETFLWAFELIQVARGPEHMLASSVQSQD